MKGNLNINCQVFNIYLNFCTSFLFPIPSVQFSHSVVSDSLRPHESQHARPPCPSPTPGVHSDSRPLSQWCHPVISSSVIPFSSCPQSLTASECLFHSSWLIWGNMLLNNATKLSILKSQIKKKTHQIDQYSKWERQQESTQSYI